MSSSAATTMKCAITGALSYSGRYLAASLLNKGHDVVNLSRRGVPIAQQPLSAPQARSLGTHRVRLDFSNVAAMARSLEGCDVLFSTYWVRFADRGGDNPHAIAAANCEILWEAAKLAGVQKIVMASHTRTSLESPFPYIAGKAKAEAALRNSGVNYAIVRPCGIFGDTAQESILMNNAAWVLRRSPLFLLAGDGSDKFQPVHVRDIAELMEELGTSRGTSGEEVDACGPDAPTSLELFTKLRDACGGLARVAPAGNLLSTSTITALTKPIDCLTGDTLLDADDLDLLTSGLTRANVADDPRIQARRSLFEWMEARGRDLGRNYVSSVERYYSN